MNNVYEARRLSEALDYVADCFVEQAGEAGGAVFDRDETEGFAELMYAFAGWAAGMEGLAAGHDAAAEERIADGSSPTEGNVVQFDEARRARRGPGPLSGGGAA